MIFETDEQIINQFMPLIISNIKLYANYPHLYEDLIEDGKEEILRALKEFDEEDGAKLPWFLKVRLRTFFRNKQKYEKRRMHGDVDIEPCDNDEREIIELFYFSEKTAKQISEIKSISQTRVFYLKTRAIDKMRNGIIWTITFFFHDIWTGLTGSFFTIVYLCVRIRSGTAYVVTIGTTMSSRHICLLHICTTSPTTLCS